MDLRPYAAISCLACGALTSVTVRPTGALDAFAVVSGRLALAFEGPPRA